MNPFKKYWEGLSERKQAGIRYAANIFILVFTVWVSVSVISYICNWKEDQSALAAGGAVEGHIAHDDVLPRIDGALLRQAEHQLAA